MKPVLRWMLKALLALAVLMAVGLGVLAWWLSGDGLRTQLEARASERLGVAVTVGRLSLDVWPLPNVVITDARLATTPPLTAQSIRLRPVWSKLLAQPRELEMASLSLSGLMLPQQALDQVSQTLSKSEHSAQKRQGLSAKKALKTEDKPDADMPVQIGLLAIAQHVALDKVTWLSKAGEALTVSGDVRLSAARDEAQVDLALGGGTLRGVLRLAKTAPASQPTWQLRGELKTQAVDLQALPGLGTRMSGRLEANTTLEAQASQLGEIGAALQTRTAFQVSGAVIKGIDVAKAVRTLGLSRGGETVLQQLSGQLTTRGAGAPMQLALTELQAQSSLLKASGAVNVGAAASAGAPRALSGRLDVDLTAGDSKVGQVVDKTVGQLVGIPLEISGTTAAPQVQPTKGAMIGGAIGSVMAPVIGTGAGAKLGDKAATKLQGFKEKLFGK
jgi:hypothetical protein